MCPVSLHSPHNAQMLCVEKRNSRVVLSYSRVVMSRCSAVEDVTIDKSLFLCVVVLSHSWLWSRWRYTSSVHTSGSSRAPPASRRHRRSLPLTPSTKRSMKLVPAASQPGDVVSYIVFSVCCSRSVCSMSSVSFRPSAIPDRWTIDC